MVPIHRFTFASLAKLPSWLILLIEFVSMLAAKEMFVSAMLRTNPVSPQDCGLEDKQHKADKSPLAAAAKS